MGRMPLKGDKLELLTTNLNYRVMVGERVSRYPLEKELLIGEAPLRKEDQPLPLYNLAAWVSFVAVQITGRDRVEIRGEVEGKAFFAGEGGAKEIIFEEEEFFQELNMPGVQPGMEVNGHGRISYLGEAGPPLETEDKLLYQVKIEVEVLLTVVDVQQLEVAVGAKNISPEKLERRVIIVEELLEEKANPLTLTSELEFLGELDYLKILSYHLEDFSWEEEKEKVHIQGTLVTSYFYSTDTENGFRENRQIFKEVITLDGLEGAQISLFPVVEYVVGEILGKQARQLAYVDLFIRVTRNVQQEVLLKIEDVETHCEYLLLPRAAGVTSEGMEIVKRIDLPYPREIAAGLARLRDLQAQVEDDGVAVSGILERYIYYIPEAEAQPEADMDMDMAEEMDQETVTEKEEKWPHSLKVEELFQYHLHLPGVRAGDEALIYSKTGKCEFAPAEEVTLGVTHAVLEVKVRQVDEQAVVVPSRVPPGTSMVIYAVKKGDNLLKISRSYGVQAADVAESNGLTEDELLQVGQKLLIPLMLYRR